MDALFLKKYIIGNDSKKIVMVLTEKKKLFPITFEKSKFCCQVFKSLTAYNNIMLFLDIQKFFN